MITDTPLDLYVRNTRQGKFSLILLLFGLAFLSGCAASFSGTPIEIPKTTDTQEKTIQVSTAAPTKSRTRKPTQTSWPTEIPTQTQTPSPTRTPTRTPITMPAIIEFPGWFADPSVNILLAHEFLEENLLVFYNADSGETYSIADPADVGGYYWLDNMHVGFLSSNKEYTYIADLQNGQVEKQPISPDVVYLVGEYGMPLKILQGADNPEHYVLADIDSLELLSMSGKYLIQGAWDDNGGYIQIVNTRTEEIIWELHNKKNSSIEYIKWSSVTDDQIATNNCRPSGEESEEGFTLDVCESLSIYDVSAKKEIYTKQGDFGLFDWSPDGTRMLYLGEKSRWGNLWIPYDDPPCILNIQARQVQCLNKITTTHLTHTYAVETTGWYLWSPDGRSIFYTVQYFDNEKLPHGQEGGLRGNICIYDLATATIRCPTEDVPEMVGNSAIVLSISPDGQYSHFCISSVGIMGDYAGEEHEAIIRSDGTRFRFLNSNFETQANCMPFSLWRPKA